MRSRLEITSVGIKCRAVCLANSCSLQYINGEAIFIRSRPKFGYVLLMMKRSQGLERAE
jgi:hypothetical protein